MPQPLGSLLFFLSEGSFRGSPSGDFVHLRTISQDGELHAHRHFLEYLGETLFLDVLELNRKKKLSTTRNHQMLNEKINLNISPWYFSSTCKGSLSGLVKQLSHHSDTWWPTHWRLWRFGYLFSRGLSCSFLQISPSPFSAQWQVSTD